VPSSEPAVRAYQPEWAWDGERIVSSPVIALADGLVVEHGSEPVEVIAGGIIPGLGNLHAHLEISPQATPAGEGLVAWVRALRKGPAPSATAAFANAAAARALGTAFALDLSNLGLGEIPLRDNHLDGRPFHEILGFDADAPPASAGRITPHAPYSTSAALIRACAARPGPWTIHVDEDPAERALLLDGTGAWPEFLRAVGRDLSRWTPPGTSPVDYLEALGVLSPRVILAHATCTSAPELRLLADRGCTIALCPRSNLHITARLPRVDAMVDAGVRVGIGTDSRASAPDLDVLADAAVLRAAFPRLPVETWLRALTSASAAALELPLGKLDTGMPALHVDAPSAGALLDGRPVARRWL
jgi:cytosine/adenosine deaminase-related metal-dependent hydrolase